MIIERTVFFAFSFKIIQREFCNIRQYTVPYFSTIKFYGSLCSLGFSKWDTYCSLDENTCCMNENFLRRKNNYTGQQKKFFSLVHQILDLFWGIFGALIPKITSDFSHQL